MPEQQFFRLQEGEKIVQEIKPKRGLLWYFMLPGAAMAFFGLITLLIFIGIFLLLFGIATVILAFLQYEKQFYWITNKRVIYKRGMVGYKISSIPLERISDVIVSRSFVESIFGFGSVHIQTLAGQYTPANRMGSEGALLAVPDPEGTQELIFKLLSEKRKREKISF